MFSLGYKVRSQGTKITVVPIKSLLHAKPSAGVNTVRVGGVYATDKFRRFELYRAEVSNK